ncbi:hypothetical protein QQP08_004898, partial [Theobroma cacao]
MFKTQPAHLQVICKWSILGSCQNFLLSLDMKGHVAAIYKLALFGNIGKIQGNKSNVETEKCPQINQAKSIVSTILIIMVNPLKRNICCCIMELFYLLGLSCTCFSASTHSVYQVQFLQPNSIGISWICNSIFVYTGLILNHSRKERMPLPLISLHQEKAARQILLIEKA